MKTDNFLKEYRERHGFSISGLARESGMSKAYLWELEQKESLDGLSIGKLLEICSVLKVSMGTLIGITHEQEQAFGERSRSLNDIDENKLEDGEIDLCD